MKYVIAINLILLTLSCGAIQVDHNVSGNVTASGTLSVQLDAASFIPFFTTQCSTLQSNDECYNSNASVCAACLAQAMFNSLQGTSNALPSPTPTGN